MIESTLSFFGRPFLSFYNQVIEFGAFLIFQLRIFPKLFLFPRRIKLLMIQLETIGFGTMGVVTLTALFTGMVEAIQLYNGFHDFGVESFMGYTIFISITKPVPK